MFFDVRSMSIRAKTLLRETKPSPMIAGLIVTALELAALVLLFFVWPLGLILLLVALVLDFGLSWYCLDIAREKRPTLKDLISALRGGIAGAALGALIRAVILAVGFMLLYVPFFIWLYGLRPLPFILRDEPGLSPFTALSKSTGLMKGHKLELFKVDLALIGWHLLDWATMGIAGVYTKPLMNTVYAEFYDYIRSQAALFDS